MHTEHTEDFDLSALDVDPPVALVLAIARLGEAGLRGWWLSHGLGQPGEYVLGWAFPRTWRCAGLELDIVSAARRHDDLLARPSALHLFSDQLPFRRMASAWLAELKTSCDHPFLDFLSRWDLETALADLRLLVHDTLPQGEPVGPGLLLGKLSSSDTPALSTDPVHSLRVAQALGGAYLQQQRDLHPPYFDLVP